RANCGGWGQAVMRDTIRSTGGSLEARSRRSGLCAAVAAAVALRFQPALADDSLDTATSSGWGDLVDAFSHLAGHEIAALALTLSILAFAVITAILLVRTRRELADAEAQARDDIMAARADADR